MRIRRFTERCLSFGVIAAATGGLGFASSGSVGQEPSRIRDGLEFRARAAASGIFVRLGDAGRAFPASSRVRWSPDSRQLLALAYFGNPVLLDANSGEVLKRFQGTGEVSLDGAGTWTARNTILFSGYGDDTLYREVPGAAWGADEALKALAGRSFVEASRDGTRAIFEGEGSEWLVFDLRAMEVSGVIPASSERTGWSEETAVASDGSALAAVAWGASGPALEVYGLDGAALGAEAGTGLAKYSFTASFLKASGSDGEDHIDARVTFIGETQMLAASLGGWVALLDRASGTEVRSQKASDAAVVGLDAAGSFLLTMDSQGVLRSWSSPGMEIVGEIEGFRSPRSLRASPDGRSVAVLEDSGRIRFVSISPAGELQAKDARPRDALSGGASSVFFGSDPNQLLVGTPEGEVIRMDMATLRGEEVPSRVYLLTEAVGGFAEWPRGNRIAFQDDGARYLDKRKRGELGRPELVHLWAGRFTPAVSADGQAFLAESRSGVVEFREWLGAPTEVPELEAPTSAALSPTGRTAAIVDGLELRIYDTEDMTLLYEGGADGRSGIDPEDFQVGAVAGFLDEHHVAVQYQDAAVRIVDTSGDVVSELPGPEDYSFLMDEIQPILSMDGRWLLCTGAEEGLRVFDLNSESLALVVAGEAWAEGVKDWSLSPDGARLAVVTDAGGVELWDFPGFLRLAQRVADGEDLSEAAGMDSPRDRARHSFLAGERLRRDRRRDEAVAAYIQAEVAAPLGLDALGARSMQRRILAGIGRCGVPVEAWLGVRAARAEHRIKATAFPGPMDPDLAVDSEILAHLMDPRRAHQEPASWDPRSGLRRSRPRSAGMRFLESLRTPNFRRSVSIFASADVMVSLWKAAVEAGGEAAGLRAQLRALDRLSLDPPGNARAARLAGFPEPGPAETELGHAWQALGDALGGAGLPISAAAARGQAMVRLRDADATPVDPSPTWQRPGAARLNSGVKLEPRDARRVQESLEWADSAEWVPVVAGDRPIESVLNYVFAPSERLRVSEALRAGDRELVVRARMTGDHRLTAAFGSGAVQVVCRFEGPVAHVRAVWASTGEVILMGQRLLADPVWAPFDLRVAVDASRAELTVQVGASAPLRGVVSPEGFAGQVLLIVSGLGSPGELALQGYRLK